MNKHKAIIILTISSLFFLPLISFGQNNNTKKEDKTVINIDDLDIIYSEDNEEYQAPVKDPSTKKDNVPPMLKAPEEEDDEELTQSSQYLHPEQMGEGVESEFDILYASMDYEVIHYASDTELPNGVRIHLTDKSKGRKFCFPTPEHARLSSHFGARKRRWHYGVDLAQPTGEPIYAAFDGIVRISKFNKSYGNLVVVRHFNGLETYYAHLSQRDVNPGDTIKAGAVIGLCGNTGRSFGSHLHFEIRYKGKAMNPEYVVDCVNHKLRSDEIVLNPRYFAKVGSSHSSPSEYEIARINEYAGTAANNASTVAENQKRDPSKPKPAPEQKTKKTQNNQAKYYKVRSGDTLSKIAARNGTTVKKLCKLNNIKETKVLQIGQKLRVR
jgi:murein DD-endopeptidase MepM/ murein hydrolase activator NlpD